MVHNTSRQAVQSVAEPVETVVLSRPGSLGLSLTSLRMGIDMLEISPDQIDAFNRDGFLVVDKIIDDATVDKLRSSFDRLFRGEFETGITPDEVNWQQDDGDPSLTRQICNGWKADRAIAGGGHPARHWQDDCRTGGLAWNAE